MATRATGPTNAEVAAVVTEVTEATEATTPDPLEETAAAETSVQKPVEGRLTLFNFAF